MSWLLIMRIVDCSAAAGYLETPFGSRLLDVTPLVLQAKSVSLLRLSPGGVVGRHPAVGHQMFAVIEGRGVVSGDEGTETAISAGQAVVWTPGESHQTRSKSGLTAVVSEGPDLTLLLPCHPAETPVTDEPAN